MLKLGVFLLGRVFSILLKFKATKAWATEKLSSWAAPFTRRVRYWVSADMQAAVAKAMDWQICEYCQWTIQPGESHEYCQKQHEAKRINKEIAECWKWHQQQQEAEEAEECEVCPCGHRHDEHDMGEGYCLECNKLAREHRWLDSCPRFGEPVENWEILTAVNLGGDPGGLVLYL